MLTTWIVTAACGAAVLQTEAGQQALVDQLERTWLAFGRPVDDAQYARFEETSRNGAAYAFVSAAVSGPLFSFGLAAVLFGIFNGALGGRAAYRQVLAVVVHASVILALRQALAAPVGYARDMLGSQASLVLFFTMLDEASPFVRFVGFVDIFFVWWVVVLAIGISILYGRPARSVMLALLGVYVTLAALAAAVMAAIGGAA